MSVRFSAKQIRLLSICVIVYTVLYFCRLNLSAALDAITLDLGISIASAGMLQTVFALVYACGQVFNGAMADRVNPFRYMMLGFLGSALCNLAMSFAQGYPMMIVIWTVNAVFQSMLWTPIVRVVALHFTGLQERNIANAALAVVLIIGHFFAWAISGVLADRFSWRLSFRVPALIALATLAVVVFFLPELKRSDWCCVQGRKEKTKGGSSSVLLNASFLLVLGTCLVYGFIRDGVITWTPTILAHIGRERAVSATAFTLILPVINTIGISIGVWQRGKGANPRAVVATMMAASVVCCLCLLPAAGMLPTAMLLGCVCATMYGANTMLTGQIPMEYDKVGKTGVTAGLIDAFIYMGSSLAGVLAGSVYQEAGVRALYAAWMVCSALCVVMMILSGRLRK